MSRMLEPMLFSRRLLQLHTPDAKNQNGSLSCPPPPPAVSKASINNSKNPEEEAHNLLIFAIISSRDLLTICLV